MSKAVTGDYKINRRRSVTVTVESVLSKTVTSGCKINTRLLVTVTVEIVCFV